MLWIKILIHIFRFEIIFATRLLIYKWMCNVNMQFTNNQMFRHLINDAHEWINEILIVSIYYLAKSQSRKRTWQNQREKKTLLNLILI